MLNAWKQAVTFRLLSSQCRSLVTASKGDPLSLDILKLRRKKSKDVVSEPRAAVKSVLMYFDVPERRHVLKRFPEELIKRKKNVSDGFYIACDDTARTIADALMKDLPPDRTLIEVNPGLGLVTEHLINETPNKLMLYEPISHFRPHLNNLIDSHPERNIIMKKVDLNMIWQWMYLDRMDKGQRVEKALSDIERSEYEDEPNCRIFTATNSICFLSHLIQSVIFQTSIFQVGRSELYMCLTSKLLRRLTCSKDASYFVYRSMSVLFQILFEYEVISKLDSKNFLPWVQASKDVPYAKLAKEEKIDAGSMYLIKAVPRRDLYQHCQPENLIPLWYFVKQHFTSRTGRVIPTLERWIPGCGTRLIVGTKPLKPKELMDPNLDIKTLPKLVEPCLKLSTQDSIEDINIFTEFGDLTPIQVLTLFDEFINWPEFKECSFNASLENTLMKLHTTPDEDVLGLTEEERQKPARSS